MRALSLALAMCIVQGCAPATLGSTSSALVSSGDMRGTSEICDSRESCGGGGGTGSVAIPVLIIITALTVPAFLHHWVFRSDPKQ